MIDWTTHDARPAVVCVCAVSTCTGEPVIGLSATDDDATWPNNAVSYVIESGSRDDFVIDSLTGHVTVSEGGAPAGGRYHVTVAAVDQGCPALRSTCDVIIYVIDAPAFQAADTVVTSVSEDAQPGHVIYRCVAVNPSGADRLRYHWLSEAAQGFDVTGQLVTGQSDYVQVRTSTTNKRSSIGIGTSQGIVATRGVCGGSLLLCLMVTEFGRHLMNCFTGESKLVVLSCRLSVAAHTGSFLRHLL